MIKAELDQCLTLTGFGGVPSSQYEEFRNKVTTAANTNPLISQQIQSKLLKKTKQKNPSN